MSAPAGAGWRVPLWVPGIAILLLGLIAVSATGCAQHAGESWQRPVGYRSGNLNGKLGTGAPAVVSLFGDSTGNARNEWFCLTADWLGEQFPAYSVSPLSWRDDLRAWEPSLTSTGLGCAPRTGAAGDRYLVSGATAHASVDDAPALAVTGDLDLRAKVAPDDWAAPVAQTVAARWGEPGKRGWLLRLVNGRPTLSWSADGHTVETANSTTAVSFAGGAAGWVRATLDVAEGTARFFTSADGATWTALGAPVDTTGPTRIFPSTRPVEIGTHEDGTDPLTGKNYYLEIRDGIGGRPVAIVDMDTATNSTAPFVDRLGNTVRLTGAPTVTGAPGLAVYNGSVVGQSTMYALEPNRFRELTPVPADIAFISYGHNHGTATSLRAPLGQLVDRVQSTWPLCRVVLAAQNPQAPPRTAAQINAQASRMAEVIALAAERKLGLVDAYTPMRADPGSFVGPDGLHPTEAAGRLWRDQAVALLASILQRPQR